MVNRRKRPLGANDRRALEMLAASGSCGCIHSVLLTRGFTVELLGLVRDGLAAVAIETVKAGGRQIEIARVRITDPGRRALAAEGSVMPDGHPRSESAKRNCHPAQIGIGYQSDLAAIQ